MKRSISSRPFSKARLHSNLERLRVEFEAKQLHVSKNLLAPIGEVELRKRCSWFPASLPDELVALYAWHDGQAKDPWVESFPFWFRDCAFSRLRFAEEEYKSMMESYGTNPDYHDLLKHCFPFAAFNGGWLVFPCKGQHLDKALSRPIISVHQGIDVWFYSIEAMVETCIDWVADARYKNEVPLPEDVELGIWQKHNPGLFAHDT